MNISRAQIGLGVYLPKKILDNDELERRKIMLPSGKILTADQILKKIGVERRHIAGPEETVADMGCKAAETALKNNKNIDLLLASTSHPVHYNLALEIRSHLHLGTPEVYDFHTACTGSARMFAYLYDNRDKVHGKKVLLVASEKFSKSVIDLTTDGMLNLDRSLGQTIFGDGSAAVSFTEGKDIRILNAKTIQLPDPSGMTNLICMAMGENKFFEPCFVHPVAGSDCNPDYPDGYFTQNGPRVYEVVRNAVPAIIRDTVRDAGLHPKDIDLVIIHPGSKRMFDALRDSLKPDFSVYSDYADGNMSSVSLLYSFIKALKENLIGSGSTVVLSGFGAGSPHLYSSTVVIEIK